MSQQNTNTNSNSNAIPVSELYWSLVDKADKKFSKIRDLPYYQRNRFSFLHFFFSSFNFTVHNNGNRAFSHTPFIENDTLVILQYPDTIDCN
jgi:hypothetical protein